MRKKKLAHRKCKRSLTIGVREDTLNMLRNGLPLKEITRARGVNIGTTFLGYLDQLVGRGGLRRSDIFFSIPKKLRNTITRELGKQNLPEPRYISRVLGNRGIEADPEDVLVIIKYGDARHAPGDTYDDIRAIEIHLHQLIRSSLEEEYGKGEFKWWRKGVPLTIRQNCQFRREGDDEALADPYCYTDLLDLWQILDKQWNVLKKVLPKLVAANEQALRIDLIRLNMIRRKIMHPVRGVAPSDDEFEFVRGLKEKLLKID